MTDLDIATHDFVLAIDLMGNGHHQILDIGTGGLVGIRHDSVVAGAGFLEPATAGRVILR